MQNKFKVINDKITPIKKMKCEEIFSFKVKELKEKKG